MICELCKVNHATLHLTEITNGTKKEIHVCQPCGQKKGLVQNFTFSLSDVISKFIDPQIGKAIKEAETLKCMRCGISYAEFRSKARFGCANDYEIFRAGVVPLLEKIHGSTVHCGKVPSTAETAHQKENELIKLRRELDKAVKQEDYERAAKLRDDIKGAEEERNKK